jgi:hypothetical protein
MYNKIRKDIDKYTKTYLVPRNKLSIDFYTLVKELAINQSNNLCYGRIPNAAILNEINITSKLGKRLKELDDIIMYQNKILVI